MITQSIQDLANEILVEAKKINSNVTDVHITASVTTTREHPSFAHILIDNKRVLCTMSSSTTELKNTVLRKFQELNNNPQTQS